MMKKIYNNKGLQFRNAFFAVIVLGMVVTAFGIIINDWNTHYDADLDYNLGNFNQNDGISDNIGEYEDKIVPSSPQTGTNFEDNTYQSVFGIITNLLTPFRVVFGQNGMIDAATEMLGLPDYVRQGIITMMIISIVFAIIAIVFRKWGTTV